MPGEGSAFAGLKASVRAYDSKIQEARLEPNVVNLSVKYRFVIAKAKPEAIYSICFSWIASCFASYLATPRSRNDGRRFFLKLTTLGFGLATR
jgi:hypothetical protein